MNCFFFIPYCKSKYTPKMSYICFLIHTHLSVFVLFFNCYTRYSKSRCIRRFKLIVERWITDQEKKRILVASYQRWCRTREARQYWREGQNEKKKKRLMSSLMSLLLLLLLFQLQGICRKTLKPFYSEHITTSRGR